MENHLTAALAATCVLLAGCTTLQAQSRVDPQTVAVYPMTTVGQNSCVTQIPGDTHFGALDLDCLRFPGQTELAYRQAAVSTSFRNRLAAVLIKQSDDVCTLEMGRLTADQAMVNAGLSSATTIFSTAGSIVTGHLAGNILAGLASGTNGIRDHINAEVYRNALSTAVTKAIREERDRQRAILEQNFAKDVSLYSVDEMIMKVNRYHQVCSFFNGLDLVVKAVDRAGLYASDPRAAAAGAIDNVRAQIASIDRELTRKDLTESEKSELVQQRSTLREHETELIKTWTALPTLPTESDTPTTNPSTTPVATKPSTGSTG